MDGYIVISTKDPRPISGLIEILEGKMLGLKSFELRIWKYAFLTGFPEKKEKAANVLRKLREDGEILKEEEIIAGDDKIINKKEEEIFNDILK